MSVAKQEMPTEQAGPGSILDQDSGHWTLKSELQRLNLEFTDT
jgi:hypothetical protein